MVHTVIIDTSVLIHNLHHSLSSIKTTPEHMTGLVKANLVYLARLQWLQQDVDRVVFVIDSKPYWRTQYLHRPEVVLKHPRRSTKPILKELARLSNIPQAEWTDSMCRFIQENAIAYKGGRKFPTPAFTKLKRTVYRYLADMNCNLLAIPGYEADDLAAGLVKILPNDKITLCTVDTDWLGLVNNNVSWYCVKGYYPQVRDKTNYNVWAEARLKVSFDQPRDLWDYKAVNGDKSDNLPKNSPLEVIDLLNPPDDFKCWLTNRDELERAIAQDGLTTYDDVPAIRYINSFGLNGIARKRIG